MWLPGKSLVRSKPSSTLAIFPPFFSLSSRQTVRERERPRRGLPCVFPPRANCPRLMPGTDSPSVAAAAGAAAAAAAGPSNAAAANNNAAAANARSASDEAMDAVAEARAVWPGAQTLVSVQELLDQNK